MFPQYRLLFLLQYSLSAMHTQSNWLSKRLMVKSRESIYITNNKLLSSEKGHQPRLQVKSSDSVIFVVKKAIKEIICKIKSLCDICILSNWSSYTTNSINGKIFLEHFIS